jgi:hypothetical protein
MTHDARGLARDGQEMVDKDPLARWGFGAVMLLGDLTRPMVPCGSRSRRSSTVVLGNRSAPLRAILREVYERTGDKPVARLDDTLNPDALRALAERLQARRARRSGAVKDALDLRP